MPTVCVYRAIKKDGTPLWPEKFTIERLEEMKRENRLSFSCQYMNEPAPGEGVTLKREWLHFCLERDLPPQEEMYRVLAVDPSASEDPDSDFFAVCMLGRGPDGRVYILDFLQQHASTPTQLAIVKELGSGPFMPNKIKIETGTLRGLFDLLVETTVLPIEQFKPTSPKDARILSMAPRFESKHVLLLGELEGNQIVPASNMQPFIDQWCKWPNVKHDDLLDVCAIGVEEAAQGVEGVLVMGSDYTEGQEVQEVGCPRCGSKLRVTELGKSGNRRYFNHSCSSCDYDKTVSIVEEPSPFAVSGSEDATPDAFGTPERRSSLIWR